MERVKLALESVTDVAGFWAPDLHPLAGASYRLRCFADSVEVSRSAEG